MGITIHHYICKAPVFKQPVKMAHLRCTALSDFSHLKLAHLSGSLFHPSRSCWRSDLLRWIGLVTGFKPKLGSNSLKKSIFKNPCLISSFGPGCFRLFFPQIDWYNLESPRRIPVTSRIIPFLVGNLYKPSFVTGSTPRIPVTNQDAIIFSSGKPI